MRINLTHVMPNATNAKAHNYAIDCPCGVERPIIRMIEMAEYYAAAYSVQFDGEKIGNDGVLCDGLESILRGILCLLDGPTGRLDCKTLSHAIHKIAKAHEINLD